MTSVQHKQGRSLNCQPLSKHQGHADARTSDDYDVHVSVRPRLTDFQLAIKALCDNQFLPHSNDYLFHFSFPAIKNNNISYEHCAAL
jgi:hypothetical protein